MTTNALKCGHRDVRCEIVRSAWPVRDKNGFVRSWCSSAVLLLILVCALNGLSAAAASAEVLYSFDRFKNVSSVSTADFHLREELPSLSLSVSADFKGRRLAKAASARIGMVLVSESPTWLFLDDHDVDMLIDGHAMHIAKVIHDGKVLSYGVAEFIQANLSLPQLERIADAKVVEGRIGHGSYGEFKLTEAQLSAVRELLVALRSPSVMARISREATSPPTSGPKSPDQSVTADAAAPAKSSDAVPESTASQDSGPVPTERVAPVYPEVARRARVSGIVIIECEVDENGAVTAAHVLKPLPFGLDDAAISAVKQWKFKAAVKDGKPVRATYQAIVPFNLNEQ